MASTISQPQERIQDFSQKLQSTERGLKQLQKSLKDVAGCADLNKLKGRIEQLHRLEVPFEDINRAVRGLGSELEEWRVGEQRSRPMRFGRELREAAEAAEQSFAVVTADPPIYRIDPFTVEADFSRGVARIEYCRVRLGEAPLQAAAILQQMSKFKASLETQGFDPESYLERLLRAYRRCLDSKPIGERVDLVDMLAEMAFLGQNQKFRVDPAQGNYRSYGRARFCYDLNRLRRSGRLSRQGLRLTLGTATIGSTRQKDRVLYLEDLTGKGQYYLSAAFVAEVRP